jgi:hypothetical protein
MNKVRLTNIVAVVLFILSALAIPVVAHEGRQIGPYSVTFGWRSEPAYVGLLNGPELLITVGDNSAPVEGMAATLKLDVIFGDQAKTLFLREAFGEPGHYVADLIPTRPGDYSFHLTGKIGDMDVDETFSSTDGAFDSIEPVSDILFPDTNYSIADLQAMIAELQAMVEALQSG